MRAQNYSLILVGICFGIAAPVHADECQIVGERAHNATLQLRDVVFHDVICELELLSTTKHDGKVTFKQTGKLQFARFGEHFFSDSAQQFSESWSNDHVQKFEDRTENSQLQMSEGSRCFRINYELNKGKKNIAHVSCNHKSTFDESHYALCQKVYLCDLLAYFVGRVSLIDITKSPPTNCKLIPDGSAVAEYSATFGTLQISFSRRGEVDRVHTIRLTQSANDCFGTEAPLLRDIKVTALGKHPNGLVSTSMEIAIEWSDGSGIMPIRQINIQHMFTSHTNTMIIERKLRMTEYRKCKSLDDFNSISIPIPDGQKILSWDPDYKSIALSYKGGEIVRQADGAPLEQVIQEHSSRRMWLARATYVGGALLSAALLYVGYRLVRRRRAKVGGA